MTKKNPLADLEAEHGFTFGHPAEGIENAKAARYAVAACRNPDCSSMNHQVQVYDDTIQPVTCGECGSLIFCDHTNTEDVTSTGGTLGSPFKETATLCTTCGTVLSTSRTELPPIKLEDLPVQILAALTGDL